MPVSQLLCEWAGAKKKKKVAGEDGGAGGQEREVGYSDIRHQPTWNYSM